MSTSTACISPQQPPVVSYVRYYASNMLSAKVHALNSSHWLGLRRINLCKRIYQINYIRSCWQLTRMHHTYISTPRVLPTPWHSVPQNPTQRVPRQNQFEPISTRRNRKTKDQSAFSHPPLRYTTVFPSLEVFDARVSPLSPALAGAAAFSTGEKNGKKRWWGAFRGCSYSPR